MRAAVLVEPRPTPAARARDGSMSRREEPELRQCAKNNVEDDLKLLRDIAVKRAQHTNKRIRFLGACELEIVDALLKRLERIS